MTKPADIRLKRPVHPGTFIRHDVIEPVGLDASDAATILGVDGDTLSSLLEARAPLSASLALRVEKAFGVSMDTLMRMQSSFDVAEARRSESEIDVQRYRPAQNVST